MGLLVSFKKICITVECILCSSGVPRLREVAGDVSLAYLRNSVTKSAPHQRNKCANAGCLSRGTMQVEI